MRPSIQLVSHLEWINWLTIVTSILAVSCTDSKTVPAPPIPPGKPTHAVVIREPETLSVEEVVLEDVEHVIGVSVGVKHRAYLVKALTPGRMSDPVSAFECRIVNDLLGGVPITVTYSETTESCRVFSSSGTQSLDLGVSGWIGDKMEVTLSGKRYLQLDPQLPLHDHLFQLTTWGSWKSEHPQTDVYIGLLNEG